MAERRRRRRWSRDERLAHFHAAGGRCAICRARVDSAAGWELDHKVALALGGADAPTNLQVVCAPCHRGKTRQDLRSLAHRRRVAPAPSPPARPLVQSRPPGARPLRPASPGPRWPRRGDWFPDPRHGFRLPAHRVAASAPVAPALGSIPPCGSNPDVAPTAAETRSEGARTEPALARPQGAPSGGWHGFLDRVETWARARGDGDVLRQAEAWRMRRR